MKFAPYTAFVGALACAGAAAAQETPQRWRVTGVLASEYVSKGLGRSGNDPHASLRVERRFGQARLGAWAGNVETSQGGDAEVHLYAGFSPRAGRVRFDLIAFYKTLPGTRAEFQDDFLEFRADASVPIGRARLRQRIEFAPDGYANTESAWWFETEASAPVSERVSLSAAVGRREQDGGADYTAWNAGATFELAERLELDVRWYDTNSHELGEPFEGRLVAEAQVRF